jgi:transcriptional regulator with XRE-family HTH domain
MNSIGARLSWERHRLGLSQEEMATRGGVRRQTQAHYEKDLSAPDGAYLAAIADLGVDVIYVLIGRRERPPLNQDLLTGVIVLVEEVIERMKLAVDPDTKAKIILNLYSTSEGKTDVDLNLAEAFVRIASKS